jgi:hypothetical protein
MISWARSKHTAPSSQQAYVNRYLHSKQPYDMNHQHNSLQGVACSCRKLKAQREAQ